MLYRSLSTRRGSASKRALDVVLGSVLALCVVPVVGVLAVGVAVSMRTTRPFFVQKRLGLQGRLFRIVKLRTLPTTVNATADKYSIADVKLTRFCRFLRSSHLDELPQLLLVPLGTMSLVGPRPEMPALAATFDPAFVEARLQVRPGCTGLWQVSVDAAKLVGETPQYDMAYVEHHSLRLDAWILWRTALLMAGRPPVELSSVPTFASPPAGDVIDGRYNVVGEVS